MKRPSDARIGGFVVGASAVIAVVLAVVIGGELIARNTPKDSAAVLASYEPSADGMNLTMTTWLGVNQSVVRSEALETEKTVVVNVTIRSRPGTYTLQLIRTEVPIDLRSPLGSRIVVDGAGKEVPLAKPPR